jgi:hypothetical protein
MSNCRSQSCYETLNTSDRNEKIMKVLDFINHASIKIEYNGTKCVTDPWYVSNAFGSWYQCPSPHKSAVYDLVDSSENFCVVVSHGHDDHLDEWFIKHHLKGKTFFCSKFQTPGLENRLSKGLGLTTKPIGSREVFGDFIFKQFINPNFTEYDAVITIETPEFLIIHANDNWHKWPADMAAEIKKVSAQYDESSVFFLIQFGIADCFPVNYNGFSDEDCIKIIDGRFEDYLKATKANMELLDLKHMYYYANQSLFEYKSKTLNGLSMYQLAQKFLSDKGAFFTQLTPGMSLYKGHLVKNNVDGDKPLFRYCLDAFENFINQRYRSVCSPGAYIAVRFKTFGEEVSEGDINYIASQEVWNRVLVGELTLESIIIGGAGVINKPNINIRDHHNFVSKSGYIAQNLIRAKGLIFYRESMNEA